MKGVQGDFAPEQLEGWTHCSFKDNGVNCEKSRCGEKMRGLAHFKSEMLTGQVSSR